MELEQLPAFVKKELSEALDKFVHAKIMANKSTYRVDKRFYENQKAFWEGYLEAIQNFLLFLKEHDAE